MRSLDIDLETFSSVDLTKSGVYPYAEAEDFDILLFAYSIDGGPVEVVDLASGESVPEEVLDALTENEVLKTAHNCAFERICLSVWMRRKFPALFKGYTTAAGEAMPFLDPRGWRCSMVWASSLGLPRSLKDVGSVLGLAEQKMEEGSSLIRYFCMPCKPTKANGGRTRNLPLHSQAKWTTFKAYNRRDVEVEMNILNRLSRFPMPPWLWEQYFLDQEINDRGILIDRGLVQSAIRMDAAAKEQALSRMREITSLPNPGSVVQMKGWLSEMGIEADSLDKKAVSALLREIESGEVAEVLALRGQVSKASVSKYKAMEAAACADSRCRGMFSFLGAGRTGRWVSKIIQLQNLARNEMPDLAEARSLVRGGDFETLALLYPSVSGVLSELVRTAFVPRQGFKFIVADFSAIEARVLSYMAGERWRMDAFAAGKDIYCESASKMFGVPVEKHGVNGHLRGRGKISELAFGYGGGTGALRAMGALEMGIPEEELPGLVSAWRAANPNVVRFWWDVDRAAKRAITEGERTEVRGLRFEVRSGLLFIRLPSGRRLSYVRPELGVNKFGGESIAYEGTNLGKWTRLETFAGKLVENCIQAVSRDILAEAMGRLRGLRVVAHVHDEVIIEATPETSVESVCERMAETPDWMPGLLLKADGYECGFYKKD